MWGAAVAVPYIFVVNKEWKWYNQVNISNLLKNEEEHCMDYRKFNNTSLQELIREKKYLKKLKKYTYECRK